MTHPTEQHDPLEAKYANIFHIGFNQFEFLIDVGQSYGEQTVMHSRFVVNPMYAKILLQTLSESLKQFETNYGELPDIPLRP